MSRGGKGRGLLNEQQLDVQRLRVDGIDRKFADHNKCLKLCLRVFDSASLSQPEKQCITSCLSKYREAERYLVEKMHHIMVEQVRGSADLKPLYDGANEQARSIVGDKL